MKSGKENIYNNYLSLDSIIECKNHKSINQVDFFFTCTSHNVSKSNMKVFFSTEIRNES